jgi:UDP-glucose:(heptosyl)LPS alpha-1,3-glucosyltransferase
VDDSRRLTLVASDVAPIGGMERVAFELAGRLLERGWNLTVIARSCALPQRAGLRFVRIRSPSRPVSLALASDFVLGSIALARHRDGIVQTNNATMANHVHVIHAHFCEAAFRKSGISRSRRANYAYRLNSLLASWISLGCERWSYRTGRVRRVACVSDGLAAEIRRSHPALGTAVRTIPNGVDVSSFAAGELEPLRGRARADLGVGPQEHVALFVGGDWHRKGLRHAIEALPAAPGWSLLVVGEGDRSSFAARASELAVRARVTFLGGLDDPRRWYAAADALVAPSAYEAFPLVVLEGAAAGLPLIVPRMNGTEELVEDGVNGWFAARDGAAIAVRLRQLAADAELRSNMGAAARRSAERFDWERVVDAFEALYDELSATGASSGSTSSNGSDPALRSRRSSLRIAEGSGER